MELAITGETKAGARHPRRPEREERGRREVERRCLVTGQVRPKEQLIRFVVDPEGALQADLKGELPGRGYWVSAERDTLEKACSRGRFARAAAQRVRVPEDLLRQVETGLERRCLELIGLARRGGKAVAGFEKVQALLRSGRAGVLIQAVDAAEQGRQRLAALGRAVTPGLPEIDLFGAVALGRAVGRDSLVHLALQPGSLTDRLLAEAARLRGLRGQVSATPLPGRDVTSKQSLNT